MSDTQEPPFTYSGSLISSKPYTLSESAYIEKLSVLPENCTFDSFSSQRQRIAWVTHSRLDIASAISFAAQGAKSTFHSADINALNDLVSYLKSTAAVRMKFPRLDKESLHMLCYADSSFASLKDGGTQLGVLILLADKENHCSIIAYRSYKSRRVVRSSGAGETLALADVFDTAIVLKHGIEMVLNSNVPLLLLTDSQSLFSVITNHRHTTERRLMLDLATLREAYSSKAVANIGLISSQHNGSDALTKLKSNQALWKVLSTA